MEAIDKKINLLIKGLVVILPLFFLSANGAGMDNIGKLFILWLVIPPILFFVFVKRITGDKPDPKRLFIDLAIIIYLVIFIFASLGSIDKFASFFGLFNNFNFPFLSVLVYVLLYFVIVGCVRDKNTAAGIIKYSLYAYIIIIFFAIFFLLGLWINVFSNSSVLSVFFSKATGTLEDFSVYIAVMNAIIFSVLISGSLRKGLSENKLRINIIRIVLFFSLWLLVIINFVPAWWCLAAGVITALVINSWLAYAGRGIKFSANQLKRALLPIVLIVIPVLFLLINYTVLADTDKGRRLRHNLLLDFSNTALVAGEAIKNNPVLGRGPETFSSAISMYRGQELNNLPGWDTRYKNGSSYIFIILASTGILGFISYLSIIGVWFFYLVKSLIFLKGRGVKDFNKKEIDNKTGILIISVSGFVSLLAGQLVFIPNTVLMFLFWLFLALSATMMREIISSGKNPAPFERSIKFRPENLRENSTTECVGYYKRCGISAEKKTVIAMSLFSFLLLMFFCWVFVAGVYVKYWAANNYFTGAAGAQGIEAEKLLVKAVNLNKYNYSYKLGLAKYYLEKALREADNAINKGSLKAVRNNINNSIVLAREAQAISPRAVAVFEALGVIYRNISRFSPDSTVLSINAFNEAAKLEPTNPVILTEIGYIYLDQDDNDRAVEYFIKATGLKDNYYRAEFGLAKVYLALGKNNEALGILKELEKVQNDVNVIYEIGRALYNIEDTGGAIKKFQEVIINTPLHANALFSLGLALEKAGSDDEALYYFKKVEQLNPDNEDIKNKIKNLQKID